MICSKSLTLSPIIEVNRTYTPRCFDNCPSCINDLRWLLADLAKVRELRTLDKPGGIYGENQTFA